MTKKTTKKTVTSKVPATKKITGASRHSTSREKQRTGILIAILLMAVGFATVTTTLTINGTINYGYDKNDFIVKFTKASVDNVESTTSGGNGPTIGNDGKEITFTTKELKSLNDTSVLTFTVSNQSSQYDANVTIKCEDVTNAESEGLETTTAAKNVKDYVTVVPKINDQTGTEEVKIEAKKDKQGTVTVTLNKVSIDDMVGKVTCNLTAVPVERTSAATGN